MSETPAPSETRQVPEVPTQAEGAPMAGPPASNENAPGKRRAPWRGRKRADNPRDKVLRIRCAATELATMEARAVEAGLSIGAYLRATALGNAGPRAVKRPRVEREQLARILGEIGKLGSNVNQIAKYCNATRSPTDMRMLEGMKADIAAMRAEVMRALGRETEA